jgi:serine O-acetyltransferase
MKCENIGFQVAPAENQEQLWARLQTGIAELKESEPVAFFFMQEVLGNTSNFSSALAAMLCHYLFPDQAQNTLYHRLLLSTIEEHKEICHAAIRDLGAFCERDPASLCMLQVFFFNKGFIALQAYRVAHMLWNKQQFQFSAQMLQLRISMNFGVDIHPKARIGSGIFLDHATGLVIGETAVVEDNVSIFHEVTLGGTGKHRGDRHPKIRKGAVLFAGAKILGTIEVGAGAIVAAGSIVLDHVPAHATVAGVPARIVKSKSGGDGVPAP